MATVKDIVWILMYINGCTLFTFLAYLVDKENRKKVKQLKEIEKQKTRDEDWAIHYAQGHNNLRFNKTLQWNLTYYSVLLFGGIIGFYMLLYNNITIRPWMRITIAVISFLVVDFGIYLTTDLQFQLRRERIGLFRRDHSFWNNAGITSVVWGTILVGFLSALFVILRIP